MGVKHRCIKIYIHILFLLCSTLHPSLIYRGFGLSHYCVARLMRPHAIPIISIKVLSCGSYSGRTGNPVNIIIAIKGIIPVTIYLYTRLRTLLFLCMFLAAFYCDMVYRYHIISILQHNPTIRVNTFMHTKRLIAVIPTCRRTNPYHIVSYTMDCNCVLCLILHSALAITEKFFSTLRLRSQ